MGFAVSHLCALANIPVVAALKKVSMFLKKRACASSNVITVFPSRLLQFSIYCTILIGLRVA